MAKGEIRLLGSATYWHELAVSNGPPESRVTVLIGKRVSGTIVLDPHGHGVGRFAHVQGAADTSVEVRHGRRLVLSGRLPDVAITDPFSARTTEP
jgi:hypothetical protein